MQHTTQCNVAYMYMWRIIWHDVWCTNVHLVMQGAASPFRDNDGLAALLAVELQADLLVLLTDVDGLYTGPPTAESSL